MTTDKLLTTAGVLLVLVSLSFIPAAAQSQHAFLWTQSGGMQDIGTIPGWQNSIGYAISSNGQVVGYDFRPNIAIAFRWTQNAGQLRIRDLGASYSVATGVNASGQIVGVYYPSTGQTHGFFWSASTGMLDIGDLGTAGGTIASAINNAGQVVGTSTTASGAGHAFLWTQSGGIQDLGTLAGGTQSQAMAINDAGIVVGAAWLSQGGALAAMWKDGHIQKLGLLGGKGQRDTTSAAYGVNKLGQVVGVSTTDAGPQHAFLWTTQTGMQDLGALSSEDNSRAQGINDSAEVVGWSQGNDGISRAFLWTQGGGMQDLGNLGGEFTAAYAINDAGQVTGYSTLP